MSLTLDPIAPDLDARIRATLDSIGVAVVEIKPLARRDSVVVHIQAHMIGDTVRDALREKIATGTPFTIGGINPTSVVLRLPADWLPPGAVEVNPMFERITAVLESVGITDVDHINPGKAADVFIVHLRESRGTDRAWVGPLAKTSLKVIQSSIKSLTVRVPADWLSDAALVEIFEKAKADVPRQRAILEELRRIRLTPTAIYPTEDDGTFNVHFAEIIHGTETTRIVKDTPFMVDEIIGNTSILLGVPRDWPIDLVAAADEPANDIGTDPAPAITDAIEASAETLSESDAAWEAAYHAALDNEMMQIAYESDSEPLDTDALPRFVDPIAPPTEDADLLKRAIAAEQLAGDHLFDLLEAQQEITRLREQLASAEEYRDTYKEIADSFRDNRLSVPVCVEFDCLSNSTPADMAQRVNSGWACVHYQVDMGKLYTVWIRNVRDAAPIDPQRAAAHATVTHDVPEYATTSASGERITFGQQPVGDLNHLSPVMQHVMAHQSQFPIASSIARNGLADTKADLNAQVLARGQATFESFTRTPIARPLSLAAGD
jgi:hypothetical protein